ncbi:MAG: peptidoglycan DD-metalloendopeptidase family protein [Daejeonella sp.]
MKGRIFFLFLIFFCLAGSAFGQTSAELKRRKEDLTREIEALNKTLKQTSSSKNLSLKQIKALNAQISLRQQKINTINSEVRLLDNQIVNNNNTVNSLQSELDGLKKEYSAMILFAFKNQNAYSRLMFLFASQDFNQAYKRLKYLQQFGEYRKKQAKAIEEAQKNLNIKIVELGHNKQEKNNLLNDQQKEKQTLGQEKNNQAKVLTGLSQQEQQLKQQITQKKKETARLNRAIQNAINKEIEEARRKAEAEARAAAAKAKAENKEAPAVKAISKGSSILSATPEAAKLSADFLDNKGRLPWPVASGGIAEGFGMHRYGANVTTENNGIDIKTAVGSTVRAVFSGEVAAVQNFGGSYAIIIRHGEYFTVYSNLRSVNVSKGQKVGLKQSIGIVLTDPTDDTTEVHFEVRKGTSAMNPSSWLAN